MNLQLSFCSHEAAKYAVMRWHYSRKMPNSKLVRVGVWEDDRYVGVVLYGCGANRHLARPFGLQPVQACELVRVALAPGRRHPTSRCLGHSLRMLREQSPGLKLVVSYADSDQGHVGTIYQATNWLYLGAASQSYLRVKGEVIHPRTLYDRYGRGGQSISWLRDHIDPKAERVPQGLKHKYVYAFDRKLKKRLRAEALPYPKRAESVDSDAPGFQLGEGGANPTSALHIPS